MLIVGVYTTKVESEQGKVTVSGNVDAGTLIKKLSKKGKHAEIWGSPKPNNNNNNNASPSKNANPKDANNKVQPPPPPPKDSGGNKGGLPQGLTPQQIKGFQDLKLGPQFMNDVKLPPLNANPNPGNQKAMKPSLPEDEGLSDDEFDDEDEDYDEDEDDEDLDDAATRTPPQRPNMMMPQMKKKAANAGGNGKNKEGGGGAGGGTIPIQRMNHGGAGKKGGNQNQGKDGKKGGGGAANTHNFIPNKGGGNDVGPMGNMPMPKLPPMANLAAVNGGGAGSGYFQGGPPGPNQMGENHLYQQQVAPMMMNQQRAAGKEGFQPMMYAPLPPDVNYMPPYPPYPYPAPPGVLVDQFSMFNDENTSSCSVM
ncbi:hypothetical protein SASPL_109184 [Salvia splendens]|uniref:HMA domain-containing protein n=1 Tax=Salvia splendens TaxID=180675 RepID=A0A8X8YGN8_SALSN|nr:hypothetical protein SASPL_109184 [Salvia splendens]